MFFCLGFVIIYLMYNILNNVYNHFKIVDHKTRFYTVHSKICILINFAKVITFMIPNVLIMVFVLYISSLNNSCIFLMFLTLQKGLGLYKKKTLNNQDGPITSGN